MVGSQPTHPIEAVFFSSMVYFEKIKTGLSNKSFEFKKNFCENVKKEMEIVTNKELSRLVAAIPSVLFFNKFNNMLETINNKLDVFSEEIIVIISKEIFRQ